VTGTLLTFDVQVVDGEAIPVPDQEIGARFSYPQDASTWSTSVTDGDGCARFHDRHPEVPVSVCLYLGDERCGTFQVRDGASLVLEV
jgi:hypothetical protein